MNVCYPSAAVLMSTHQPAVFVLMNVCYPSAAFLMSVYQPPVFVLLNVHHLSVDVLMKCASFLCGCFNECALALCVSFNECVSSSLPEGSDKWKEVNKSIKRCMKKANENWKGGQCGEIEENLSMNNGKRAYQQ